MLRTAAGRGLASQGAHAGLQSMDVGQDLAEEILRTLSPLSGDGKPYFAPEQRSILVHYIITHLQYIQTDALSRDKPRLATEKRAIQQEFDVCQSVIARDSENTPEIFKIVHARCQEKAKQYKITLIQSIFPESTVHEIQVLSDAELTQKHAQCVILKRVIDSVNEKLHYLTHDKAKLASPVVVHVSHRPTRSLDAAASMFRITAQDLTVGYSIHNMLAVNKIYATGMVANTPYAGELTFDLSREDLALLNGYLSDLYVWYHDFDMILGCLLGISAEPFTKTGQKPLSEIIKTEVERRVKGLPVFIAPAVTEQLKALPQDRVVMLIGQVALDLSAHPDRSQLKALLEKMYSTHDLKDSKKDLKTFIRDRGYEYVSLLSIPNIEAIFDDLMAHATLASIARGMGFSSGTSDDFLGCFETPDPRMVYHQFLLQKLTELPIGPLNRLKTAVELSVQNKVDLRRMADSKFPLPRPADQIKDIQERFDKNSQDMLNALCGISLQPMVAEAMPRPTEEQLRQLLPAPASRAGVRELYPNSAADMDFLCRQLKSSETYQAAIEPFESYRQELAADGLMVRSLDEQIDQLNDLFKQRFRAVARVEAESRSNLYYGTVPFLIALKSFMSFVSKTHYQSITGISQASFNTACKSLCQILMGSDMADGCELGFAGRMVELDTTLTAANDNPIEAADLNLRKDMADRLFIQHCAIGTESSMAYVYKQAIYAKIGLAMAPATEVSIPANKKEAFINAFAAEYTPSAIYQACFSTLIENFKAYMRDDEDQKIYELLQSLGFTGNVEGDISPAAKKRLDDDFRLNAEDAGSKWNLSKFNLALPEALIRTLILKNKIDVSCAKQLLLPLDTRASSTQAFGRDRAQASYSEYGQREPAPYTYTPPSRESGASYGAFFSGAAAATQAQRVDRPAPAAAARPTPASGNPYGVFARPEPRPEQVQHVANSNLATKPADTSAG